MIGSNFVEVSIPCAEYQKELLIAVLDEAGYDSILETEEGLKAYILAPQFIEDQLNEIAAHYDISRDKIIWEKLEEKNWNAEWEKNFDPIIVENLCHIRAPFHQSKEQEFNYEIIIQPKMSFGTGHHATTYLMVKNQIKHIDHTNKKVMDAGCGTAILSVMAEKLGASETVAFDIDEWSVENAPENVELNGCSSITTLQGTIDNLSLDKDFDIILANINKNVLLAEIPAYAEHLNTDGLLLLSGFYTADIDELEKRATENGFKKLRADDKNDWACLLYKKS